MSERRGARLEFVSFTSALVTPFAPSNLPRVKGFACCPVRLNWSWKCSLAPGLCADGLGEARGISSDSGKQGGPELETERAEM